MMGGGKGGKGNNTKGYCIPFMIDEMPPQCPRRSIFLKRDAPGMGGAPRARGLQFRGFVPVKVVGRQLMKDKRGEKQYPDTGV